MEEFENGIYPRKLWVSIGDKGIERFLDTEPLPYCNAQTEDVVDKETLQRGYLIRFRTKKCMDHETIAHEAVHAGLFICNSLGIKVVPNNSEPLAYLVEWIVRCCEKARKNL